MIKKLEISGVHSEVGERLRKYTIKKFGALDRYMPRSARESAHLEVKLIESKAHDKNRCTCEIILHLPKDTLTIKEATINMFAAVDIVEAKLKNQLKKYKDTHSNPRIHRRLINRLRHQTRGQI